MLASPTGGGHHGVPIFADASHLSGNAIGRLSCGNCSLREAGVVRAARDGVSASAPAEVVDNFDFLQHPREGECSTLAWGDLVDILLIRATDSILQNM